MSPQPWFILYYLLNKFIYSHFADILLSKIVMFCSWFTVFRWKISTDPPSYRIPNLHRKSEIQKKKNIPRCLNSKLSAVCFWKCKNITLNSNLEFCVRQMFFLKLEKRHGAWKGMWSFLTKICPNLTKIGVHLFEYKY